MLARTRLRLLLPVLPLLGLAVVVPAPAAAAVPTTVVASADYATEVLGDPWDFSNPDDALLDGGLDLDDAGPTSGLRRAEVRDGQLRFSMTSSGYLSPVWGGYPGALYLGREAGAPERQVDAARFTRLSFHLYASEATPAGVQWFGCEGLDPACWGGQPFLVRPGWNTYNLLLGNAGYGLPQEWEGRMTGLRLALSPSTSTTFALDWMRLHEPTPTVEIPKGGQWDVDDDPADNVPERPGWGRVNCPTDLCDLSFLPPGTYRVRDSDTAPHTGPVTVLRRARPVVLDPDEVGGLEHAAADPWDFSAPTDVGLMANARMVSLDGRLVAENDGPVMNDPHVWLPLRSPTIDPRRFHRLTVRSGYAGAFDLRDIAGGGTMGRVVWQYQDDGYRVHQTADLVTYGGTRTLTVDLSGDVHEKDADAGEIRTWGTGEVSGIRWDPNEDRGRRQWYVERIALRADDEAGTSFDVRWHDLGYAPGSTARLFAVGADGVRTPISSEIVQQPGVNRFRWRTARVAEGRYLIEVDVNGPAGSATSVSTGPVQVVEAIGAGQAPSPATPLVRDLTAACPQSRVPAAGFDDVARGSLHQPAVDCVSWWGVSRGYGAGFRPDDVVTRGQMATFLAGVVERSGGALPADPPDAFDDDAGSVHEGRINQLAALGVVAGYGDRRFDPLRPVTRDQMATFLVRAYEHRAGAELPLTAEHFDDDGASAHEAAIDKAAGAGIAGGVAENRYAPDRQVQRGQMASFLVRTLDLLVTAGYGAPPVR